jgi:hypothetical protein
MNSVVRAALHAVRREQIQKAREQAKGKREILSPFVFCSHKGRFLYNLAKDWYPGLKAAGIEDFRFHDLRIPSRPGWSWRAWTSTRFSGREDGKPQSWSSGTPTYRRTMCGPLWSGW